VKIRRWQGAAAAALPAALLAASAAGCGSQPAPSAGGLSGVNTGGPVRTLGHRVLTQARKIQCPAFVGALPTPGGPEVAVGGGDATADQTGQHLPSGFVAVAVVECVRSVVPVKGRGQWEAVVKRVATSGLGPLMAALRRPSSRLPNPDDVACPMTEAPLPWFELVGKDGHVIQPAIPRASCGQPITAIVIALDKLPWLTLSRTLQVKYKPLINSAG
jgi:hypothetical protein